MILRITLLLLLIGQCASGAEVKFSKKIAPLLMDQCLSCHSEQKAKGGYRVHTFEELFVAGDSEQKPIQPGNPSESELYKRLITLDEDDRMPQKANPLRPDQIELIRQWIDEGAKLDTGVTGDSLVELAPGNNHPAPPRQYPRPVPILSLAFDPSGKTIATGGYHEILLWELDGQLRQRITNAAQRIHGIAFHPDGQVLAAAGGKPGRGGELAIYNATTGGFHSRPLETADEMLAVAFSPSGKHLAVAGSDNAIHIFDAGAWKEIRAIEQHADWVTSIQFSPDGKHIASASRDRTARIYEVESGELAVSYTEHTQPVCAVTFLPEGRLASAGRDKAIHIWKSEDGKRIRSIGSYNADIHALAVFEDNLFSSASDRLVRQQTLEGKSVRTLEGHEAAVFALTIHAGTALLATGSYDGVVKIWKIDDGSLLHSFVAAPGFTAARQFNAAGGVSLPRPDK